MAYGNRFSRTGPLEAFGALSSGLTQLTQAMQKQREESARAADVGMLTDALKRFETSTPAYGEWDETPAQAMARALTVMPSFQTPWGKMLWLQTIPAVTKDKQTLEEQRRAKSQAEQSKLDIGLKTTALAKANEPEDPEILFYYEGGIKKQVSKKEDPGNYQYWKSRTDLSWDILKRDRSTITQKDLDMAMDVTGLSGLKSQPQFAPDKPQQTPPINPLALESEIADAWKSYEAITVGDQSKVFSLKYDPEKGYEVESNETIEPQRIEAAKRWLDHIKRLEAMRPAASHVPSHSVPSPGKAKERTPEQDKAFEDLFKQ